MQTSHLTVSTKISDAPSFIVQRVKGRLYYLVKQRKPKPFHGNFAIRSIGKSSLAETQQYVMNQLGHHKMADPKLQSSLETLQIRNEDVDLSRLETSSHGAYWYNLHMVFVHRERWSTSNVFQLERVQQKIISVAKLNGLRLAAAGVLTDHVHLLAGCPYAQSPQNIAIEFLNALGFKTSLSIWRLRRNRRRVHNECDYVARHSEATTLPARGYHAACQRGAIAATRPQKSEATPPRCLSAWGDGRIAFSNLTTILRWQAT
jgi:REP element-mobilizing transposase RayT